MHVHFIGGTHGAGKSTLGAKVGSMAACEIAKASDLIRFARFPGDPTGKAVADVEANQRRLLAALRARSLQTERLLLDGHYCLWNLAHVPVQIPLQTFRDIGPSSLILVEEIPATIKERLDKRDGADHKVDAIERLVDCEKAHAAAVAKDLGVPLCVASATSTPEEIVAFIINAERRKAP
jgi:hypothetical protein